MEIYLFYRKTNVLKIYINAFVGGTKGLLKLSLEFWLFKFCFERFL